MLAVVATAKTFSLRPSELLGIGDEVVALAFDLAAAMRVQMETARNEERGEVNRVFV